MRVADQGGLTFDKSFTITITDVNEAPINATLTGGSVAKNTANGTAVGTVTGVDRMPGNAELFACQQRRRPFRHQCDHGAITVANGTLLDYEAAASHTITVRVTGQGGLTFDKSFIIAVTINETPTNATLSGGSVAKCRQWDGCWHGDRHRSGRRGTLSYSLTDNAGGRFAIKCDHGSDHGREWGFSRLRAVTSHTITVRVTDQGGLTLTIARSA